MMVSVTPGPPGRGGVPAARAGTRVWAGGGSAHVRCPGPSVAAGPGGHLRALRLLVFWTHFWWGATPAPLGDDFPVYEEFATPYAPRLAPFPRSVETFVSHGAAAAERFGGRDV